MLGWIDQRLWQAKGLMDVIIVNYLVIPVRDTAQLPLATYKFLYYPTLSDALSMLGYVLCIEEVW